VTDGPISNLPSNDRASLDRTTESIVRRLIGAGIAVAARFTTSLRVGSGAATLAALDGTDGLVMADGAAAGFYFRNRANATKYGALYRDGTLRLFASETGDLWLVDQVTGLITQSTWTTAPAFINTYTAAVTVAYRTIKPTGDVAWRGQVNLGVSSLGNAMFTIPAGFRPSLTGVSAQEFPVPVFNGANWTGGLANIAANGDLSIFGPAGTVIAGLDGLRYPTA
jgi:hypothetical protein